MKSESQPQEKGQADDGNSVVVSIISIITYKETSFP